LKVKKFIAGSMPEAMKNVRKELGNNAVILNSRVVFSGGFLGLFRKKNIEVIAAVDQSNPAREPKPVSKEKRKPLDQLPDTLNEDVSQAEPPGNPGVEKDVKANQSDHILREIANIKELIQNQSIETAQANPLYPEPVQRIEALMTEQEFSSSLKKKMTRTLMQRWFQQGPKTTTEEMAGLFTGELVKFLSAKPFGGISFTKKYVTVIGPTGVGKTTTLAKLAANCLLDHQKKVAFITTDTYRIAAIEQLKTYAQILNVPLEVCYNSEEFQTAKEKFSSYDIVLIDTAGRNFRNKLYVEELKKMMDFNVESEVFLVLSLTAKQKDMEAVVQSFSDIPIGRFIFTKADEASCYGSMINLIDRFGIGVAYITNGQNVPDDVAAGTPETIAKLVAGVK